MTAISQFRRPHRTAKVAIGLSVDLVCRVSGRRNVVRAAQWALNRARLDVGADMQANGEVALQGWALDLAPGGRRVHVVDVGANVGQWSRSLLETAEHRGRANEIDLHAFEPSASTFEELVTALDSPGLSLQRMALSDQAGTALLHIERAGSQRDSLHEIPGVHSSAENIVKTTLDTYARQAGLSQIDLLKIDAEGHDLAVLAGARGLLRQGRITIAQFEYNRVWIYARQFLYDAFELLSPLSYQIGKLTPRGVVFYSNWDPELETFTQAQYVACTKETAERLPRVEWWNTG